MPMLVLVLVHGDSGFDLGMNEPIKSKNRSIQSIKEKKNHRSHSP
jgi:hypothetical protein